MEGIEKTSYKYNNDFKNPITYYIQTKTVFRKTKELVDLPKSN